MKRSYSQSTTQESSQSQGRRRIYRKKTPLKRSYTMVTVPKKVWRGPTPYETVYRFERSCAFVTNVNEANGFIGPGSNVGQWLGIEFGLQGASVFINGNADSVSNIPNVTEFQALFDQGKIERVDITPIFSNNTSSITNASTVLPIIYQAFDYDSVGGVNSLFEYPQCKTLQLGSINNGTTTFTLWKPTVELVSGTTASGATIDVARVSPWFDTTTVDVAHRGVRFQFQNFGRTPNTDIGSIVWQIKIYYAFKYAR